MLAFCRQKGYNTTAGKPTLLEERTAMEYDFYTLGVLYLVYSFAGWVGETVVATVRGKHFANRGAAAGPFCFVYGSTAPSGSWCC